MSFDIVFICHGYRRLKKQYNAVQLKWILSLSITNECSVRTMHDSAVHNLNSRQYQSQVYGDMIGFEKKAHHMLCNELRIDHLLTVSQPCINSYHSTSLDATLMVIISSALLSSVFPCPVLSFPVHRTLWEQLLRRCVLLPSYFYFDRHFIHRSTRHTSHHITWNPIECTFT